MQHEVDRQRDRNFGLGERLLFCCAYRRGAEESKTSQGGVKRRGEGERRNEDRDEGLLGNAMKWNGCGEGWKSEGCAR